MWQVVAYIGVCVTGLFFPLWLYAIAVVSYALLCPGDWLILIGILIDAQFGIHNQGFPFTYTLLTGAIVLVLEFIKPHLSFYTE